jgi:hypothetical protein
VNRTALVEALRQTAAATGQSLAIAAE